MKSEDTDNKLTTLQFLKHFNLVKNKWKINMSEANYHLTFTTISRLSYLVALNDEYFSDVRRLRMYDGTRYSFSLTTYFRSITYSLKETKKEKV